MREKLARFNWFLTTQAGLDIRKLIHFPMGLVKYIGAYTTFKRIHSTPLRLLPCLHDWREEAGSIRSEYFWQDLLVARMIFEANPVFHVDVGSRLDGFVAHVACFRNIEVLDIRQLSTKIPGVSFRQANLMDPRSTQESYTDSLSCLHAIEHFGLGRYGDPLQPDGLRAGIENLARLLKPNGILYLSCPVGKDEIYFNAHRAVRPHTIVGIASNHGLALKGCWLFASQTCTFVGPVPYEELATSAETEKYTLAVYSFQKSNNTIVL